jgi:hypothetical protein
MSRASSVLVSSSSPRRAFPRSAEKRIREKFSLSKMVSAYESLYETIGQSHPVSTDPCDRRRVGTTLNNRAAGASRAMANGR